MNPKRFVKRTAIVMTLLMIVALLLPACEIIFGVRVTGIDFADSAIILELGEVRSPRLNISPSKASNKLYTLSSPGDVIAIDNAPVIPTVRALKIGETTLTATSVEGGYTSTCAVRVVYADIMAIQLQVDGDLLQHIDQVSQVRFTAVFGNNADPKTQLVWTLNDNPVSVDGATFDYTPPNTPGTYTVKATVNGASTIFASDTIYVYEPITDAVLSASRGTSDLIQIDESASQANSSVSFDLSYTQHNGNPPPQISWTINDEVVWPQSNCQLTNTFARAGLYRLRVMLNGQPVPTEYDGEGFDIVRQGTIVPENLWVDYDNSYPDISVTWDRIDGISDFVVRINSKEYDSQSYPSLFSDCSFNARTLVDISATNTFSVKAAATEHFAESAYSISVTPTPIPKSVPTEYLTTYYYGTRNRYLTSQLEFDDLVAYAILFRKSSIKAYVAFDYGGDIDAAFEHAFNVYSATGEYAFGCSIFGKVLTINLDYKTQNYPTERIGWMGENTFSGNPFITPHIATGNIGRNASYVFAIDRLSTAVSVSTSEELFYIARLGLRPNPVPGSRAETIYNNIRGTLRNIISDSMTDVDKMHAIYDYLMAVNTYDIESSKATSISKAVKLEAFYLEGVFGSASRLAVCDGLAKSMVTMARIEGIEAIKVNGVAGTAGNRGGHAWVKARVDGKWYNIDPTWGDYKRPINTTTAIKTNTNVSYEMASHEYFLLTDAQLAATHIADIPNNNPPSTTEEFDIYQHITYQHQGQTFDAVLDVKTISQLTSYADFVVDFLVNNHQNSLPNTGIELRLDDALPNTVFQSIMRRDSQNPFIKAFNSRKITNYTIYLSSSDTLFVWVS